MKYDQQQAHLGVSQIELCHFHHWFRFPKDHDWKGLVGPPQIIGCWYIQMALYFWSHNKTRFLNPIQSRFFHTSIRTSIISSWSSPANNSSLGESPLAGLPSRLGPTDRGGCSPRRRADPGYPPRRFPILHLKWQTANGGDRVNPMPWKLRFGAGL